MLKGSDLTYVLLDDVFAATPRLGYEVLALRCRVVARTMVKADASYDEKDANDTYSDSALSRWIGCHAAEFSGASADKIRKKSRE
jgi:hypothetical protein